MMFSVTLLKSFCEAFTLAVKRRTALWSDQPGSSITDREA